LLYVIEPGPGEKNVSSKFTPIPRNNEKFFEMWRLHSDFTVFVTETDPTIAQTKSLQCSVHFWQCNDVSFHTGFTHTEIVILNIFSSVIDIVHYKITSKYILFSY